MLAQVGDLLPALGTRISGLEVDDGNVGKRDNCDEDDNGNVGERSLTVSLKQTLKWTNLVCESWLDFLSVL